MKTRGPPKPVALKVPECEIFVAIFEKGYFFID
jgi:hypothetical protein